MKRNNKNKKRRYNKGIPFGVDRLDKETMSEIKMFYSLCNNIEATAKAYHVSRVMVEYAVKNGSSFNDLQKQIIKEKEENEWWIIQ